MPRLPPLKHTTAHYAGEDLKKCNFAWIDDVCVLVCKRNLCTEGKTKLSGMTLWTITFPGNILFWFCDNCVASDAMLLTITHYAGGDLKKFNFAWIDDVCVLVCEKISTLKARRNFQEWKYRQLPFQGIFCFDSVITVSPVTRCCLHWFLSPNFFPPTSSSCRQPFSEGKHFLSFWMFAQWL